MLFFSGFKKSAYLFGVVPLGQGIARIVIQYVSEKYELLRARILKQLAELPAISALPCISAAIIIFISVTFEFYNFIYYITFSLY